jgi:hypothetical protein
MKKKTKVVFYFLSIVFAALTFIGCDMTMLDEPFKDDGRHVSGPDSGKFTDDLEVGLFDPFIPLGYDPSIPCLTIINLPDDTQKDYISNVFIYNSFGNIIAKCAAYNQIAITTYSDYSALRIPLAYNSSGEPFRDSANLTVSFSFVIIDSSKSPPVAKNTENSFSVSFNNGSGIVDFLKDVLASVELGYFSGGLENPSDAVAPIIKSGTMFEMNGVYYTVKSNMAASPSSFSNSCIVYVYARLVNHQLDFICSTAAPSYDFFKKGYYNGFERALFKFIFIRDSSNKCFVKSFINSNWSHLRYQTVESYSLASQNLSQQYYLSGTGNPQPQSVTLPAGVYLFALNGAAGGSSPSQPSASATSNAGGSGGHISEVVILTQNTSFTFFTGQAGGNGGYTQSSGYNQSATVAGAGGGSGSFAFSPDGYFLCSGGGGGASGTAPGGAGGSIGGGGGGASVSSGTDNNVTIMPSSGGSGGGLYNNLSVLTAYSYSLGFNGTNQGSSKSYIGNAGAAAYLNLSSPNTWLNTNNANGQGASVNPNSLPNSTLPKTGGNGGNNRNSTRGGGGGVGSIVVFKIN